MRQLEKRKKRLQRQVARKYKINKKGGSYKKTNNIFKPLDYYINQSRYINISKWDRLKKELINFRFEIYTFSYIFCSRNKDGEDI